MIDPIVDFLGRQRLVARKINNRFIARPVRHVTESKWNLKPFFQAKTQAKNVSIEWPTWNRGMRPARSAPLWRSRMRFRTARCPCRPSPWLPASGCHCCQCQVLESKQCNLSSCDNLKWWKVPDNMASVKGLVVNTCSKHRDESASVVSKTQRLRHFILFAC